MQIQWTVASGRENPHTQLSAERICPKVPRPLVTTEAGIFLFLGAPVTSAASFPHLGCLSLFEVTAILTAFRSWLSAAPLPSGLGPADCPKLPCCMHP